MTGKKNEVGVECRIFKRQKSQKTIFIDSIVYVEPTLLYDQTIIDL